MNSAVRAVYTVAIFAVLAGCGGSGGRSSLPGVSANGAARAPQSGGTPALAEYCRVVVESATASGSPAAMGTYECDPTDAGQAEGIAANTAGGYDVLFTDTTSNIDVVRRFGNDGAATVSTLALDFFPLDLATDRGGHDVVDTSGGRIVMYAAATTDPTMRASDVTLASSPQLGAIAISPAADRTVYVAAGALGSQSIYALAPGSATILRTIGPFPNNDISALAVDTQGSLYVALNSAMGGVGSVIRVYDSMANGKPMPLRSIFPSPGLTYIRGLAVSPALGLAPTVYAAETTTVHAYPLSANGTTSPSRTITPHPNQQQIIAGLAVSADGTLDIAENYFPPQPVSCTQNAVTGVGVPLGSVATFAVLAGSTVTNLGPTAVTGDLGVSPGTAVTGFGPGTVTGGSIHAGDATAAQAQLDLTTAYNNAAGRVNPAAVPADIGGTTIVPGIYTPPVSLAITGDVTLDAVHNPNGVWIFQIPSTLVTAPGSHVILTNGANACNVFWQVGSSATLNSTSNFSGTIMSLASVSLGTGATVSGRALARSGGVTLLSNTVTVTGP